MSSLGEIIGAELYLTELIKNPTIQYPVVALIACFANFGSVAALGVAFMVTFQGVNWRIAFFIGTVIAITGGIARIRLKETPDFIDAKRQVQNSCNKAKVDIKILEYDPVWKEKVNWKTSLSYLVIQCSWPVSFFLAYIYCGNILRNIFNYHTEEVIKHNFIVSIVQLFGGLILRSYLSSKVHPLKILRLFLVVFSLFIVVCPYWLNNIHSPFELLVIQSIIVVFGLGDTA